MKDLILALPLIELSITFAAAGVWFLQKLSSRTFPFAVNILLVIMIGNLLFWPMGMQLPLIAYIRGFTGDLSVVLTLLLWSSLLPSSKPIPSLVKLAIAIVALSFYPFALGVGMIDPYAWGYGSLVFLISVSIFALICALANWTKGTWIIALAIVAWSVGWHESTNLWDYILDPILFLWVIGDFVGSIYGRRKAKARSGYLFRAG